MIARSSFSLLQCILLLSLLSLHFSLSMQSKKSSPPSKSKLFTRLVAKKTPISSSSSPPSSLKGSAAADSSSKELFAAKLREWRALKEEGLLTTVNLATEEAVEELDAKVLSRRGAAGGGLRELDEESVARMAVELGLARNESTVRSEFNKTLSALSSKTSSIDTSSSPVAIYALFNEMKDKKALDAKLAEEILLLLSRSKSPPSSYVLTALKQYIVWVEEKKLLEGGTYPSPSFLLDFINSCASSGSYSSSFFF